MPPPWKRKRRPERFEGDVAIVELRANLALTPDEIPAPPLHHARLSVVGVVGRLVMVAVLAGAGAYGLLWLSSASSEPQPAPAETAGLVALDLVETAVDLKADRVPQPIGLAPYSVADYARDLNDRAPVSPVVPVRAPLSSPPETRIAKSVPATAASVPVRQPAAVAPPSAVAPPPAVAPPEPDEIAALLVRSRAYLAAGDVAAARLVLRRAVEGGDSDAALALGSTYDPIVLKRLGVISFAADPAQAREWYSRAAELGSDDASMRIEQLAQADR